MGEFPIRAAAFGRRVPRLLAAASVLALAACSSRGPEIVPVVSVGGVSATAEGTSLYARGKRHFAAKRYGLAAQDFEAALLRMPGDPATLAALGATYDQLGRFDLADRSYRKALALDPMDRVTLNNVGWSYFLRGQHALARVYLGQARRLDPEDPVAETNLRLVEATLAARPADPPREDERIGQAEAKTPDAWIERTSASVQTLVLNPPDSDDAAPPPAGVPIELAAVSVVRPTPAPAPVSAVTVSVPLPPPVKPLPPAAVSPPFRDSRIEISNGAGRERMAARLRDHLVRKHGVDRARLTNAKCFCVERTVVFFRKDHERQAAALAALLPAPVEIRREDGQAADLRVVLGRDLLSFDRSLIEGIDRDA